MENRFGLKDLILTSLFIVLIVSVWLAMKQRDRQWNELQGMKQSLGEQATELTRVRKMLEIGARVAQAPGLEIPNASEFDPTDPFTRIRRSHQAEDYAVGGWLINVFGQTVGKITPIVDTDAYQSRIEGHVVESLAVRDPDSLQFQPWIAKSWEISDDGKTFTFDLRTDVSFSDGEVLTARDVVYTFELTMNPKIAAPSRQSYYANIHRVFQVGDHRVVFEMKEPYFKGFEMCAGLGILPEHFYSRFTPDQFNEEPGLLFGSGPYRIQEPEQWKPGTGVIELLRNENYWGPRPTFDKIVYREITDETARLVTFTNGDLDVFAPSPEQYQKLKDDERVDRLATWYEYETITGGYRYVGWNQMRQGKATRFADRRVRQALTMLTNRKEMCQRLMVGLATVTSGPFHRLGNQANPSIEPWPYDAARARALLKESGFEDRDGDGVIEDPDLQPFLVKLIYPASSTNYQQMALYLKDAFARAGVVLEPDPLEWNVMLQRINQRDFDAITLGWSGVIESDPYQIFHSSQIKDGANNYVSYTNTELDELIERARYTPSETERMEMWHRCHQILHEDQPYTFLFTRRAVTLANKRLKNVHLVKLGINSDMEWYVPLTLQKWASN